MKCENISFPSSSALFSIYRLWWQTWNSQENELNEASPFAQFVIFLINHSLFAIFRLLLIFTLSLFMELFSCWCICNKWEVILVNGITPPGESLPGRLHPLDTLAICIQHSHTISYNILKFQDFPTRLIPITIVSVLCGEVTKTFGWGWLGNGDTILKIIWMRSKNTTFVGKSEISTVGS